MSEINRLYPHGLSDADIEKYIRSYAEEIFTKRGDINTVMWAAPMIHLGRAELQSRAMERSSRFSKWVSYSSMGVALIALAISILNSWSSSRWEERQLQSLAALDQRLSSLDTSTHQVAVSVQSLTTSVADARKAVSEAIAAKDAANKSLERTRER